MQLSTTLALALMLACACGGESRPRRARDRAPEPAPERAQPEAIPSRVATETLEPSPMRVRLEDLPRPYATDSARQPPQEIDPPEDARLRVPRGFVVQRFASDLPSARWLAETPDGRVLLAQSRENRITLLEDANADGVAEARHVFADEDDGLDLPFGMAFAGDHFYLANQDEVRRYPWRDGQRELEGEGERITQLPGGGYRQHWTRNVLAHRDRLFVSVGSESNAEPEREPRATIQVMDLDGRHRRTFASGLRNPVGMAIHPRTGELWTTVNERDELGDDLVPDYLARVVDGAFYGWPYAYLSPELVDPRLADGAPAELVRRTRTPEVLFTAHSAALGLAFYDGDAFPERYRGGAFVAMRGSWNRSAGVGYMIAFVPFDREGNAIGHYEEFVTGFLVDPSGPTTWGRPVGVIARSDGSLLFTEESGGHVYRVSHR